MKEVLLDCRAIEAGYGASQVLFGIDLSISAGQVVSMLGRNGMGKSTTLKTLVGSLVPLAGSVSFAGQSLAGLKPDAIARLGISLVPEGRRVFPNLTVREHLVCFADNRSGTAKPWTMERIYQVFPKLKERASNLGNQLSGGEQQMLAIGRALSTNPRLLILDEATEGLAPVIREEIWRCLATLKAEGQTILVVDKYVHKLVGLADHHLIVERGQVVWAGDSAALNANRSLWTDYLGV
jgi:branched-chain amino acid transport system ATP-binding protein